MKPKICDKSVSFSECELVILRLQVDASEHKQKKQHIIEHSAELSGMFKIIEDFLKRKKNICYGGIAINALLPENDKIYDESDLPDYDFFSADALNDAKELVNIYIKHGYTDVEAKSGQHHGTYKVFVNFQGMADITNIPKGLFNAIKQKAVDVKGILYTDPVLLQMSMYLELSRPDGDTSRWEKVFKRLRLINKYYPLPTNDCNKVNFQRKMENMYKNDEIYEITKNALINNNVVFFGGFAISQYLRYMPKHIQKQVNKIADFDVLSIEPLKTANIIKNELNKNGINNVSISKKSSIGEILPLNYEIKIGNDTIAFIYQPLGCHSYNILNSNHKQIKIATIDTMLSFYLAFMYANKPYYDLDRILCMSNFLFEVQKHNRLEQKGLLKRFSIDCYGYQPSLEDLKREKAKKFIELKDKKGTKEYEEWFLNYAPLQKNSIINNKKMTSNKTKNKAFKYKMKNKTLKKKGIFW